MAQLGNSIGGEMQEFDAMIPGMTPPQLAPYVEILEQPRARGLRFRYECEGRVAGSIPGEHSTTENRTYPKIQIHNSNASDAIVVVSTVTKDEPPRPHPHSLVGRDCKNGVCTVKLKKQSFATFPNLGIQCAKKKGVLKALDERKLLRVDPYQTGFEFGATSFDLTTVRICFQVFLPDTRGKFTRIVPPSVSQCIYDRKTVTDLVICRVSRQAGSAKGGQDVFLLCDKVNKEDVEVRFYEEDRDGLVVWEARGDFGPPDVHRQYAIVFNTPPYRDQSISQPVSVLMQLKRPSDGEHSQPLQFTYTPIDPDPYGLSNKRAKLMLGLDGTNTSPDRNMQVAGDMTRLAEAKQKIQNRILAKPRRNRTPGEPVIKQEECLDNCLVRPDLPGADVLSSLAYNTPGMDSTQINAMVSADSKQNPQSCEWESYISTVTEQQMPDGVPQPEAGDNGETAQNLLSELAVGGSNSLSFDNSLLDYLDDTSEKSSILLSQFLQANNVDMQS